MSIDGSGQGVQGDIWPGWAGPVSPWYLMCIWSNSVPSRDYSSFASIGGYTQISAPLPVLSPLDEPSGPGLGKRAISLLIKYPWPPTQRLRNACTRIYRCAPPPPWLTYIVPSPSAVLFLLAGDPSAIHGAPRGSFDTRIELWINAFQYLWQLPALRLLQAFVSVLPISSLFSVVVFLFIASSF